MYCEVVDRDVPNLLGAKNIERLGLVKSEYHTNKSSDCVVKQKHGLVQGK